MILREQVSFLPCTPANGKTLARSLCDQELSTDFAHRVRHGDGAPTSAPSASPHQSVALMPLTIALKWRVPSRFGFATASDPLFVKVRRDLFGTAHLSIGPCCSASRNGDPQPPHEPPIFRPSPAPSLIALIPVALVRGRRARKAARTTLQ